ncbi:ArsR/SmtB family transcription factor [Paenibacillus chungangensis]|uniref:ArsR/SmtB family transcription factor n=1 Tax=Paenibacillus chungangensis TaxID=696535 RepID=A0ABW3HNX3_9BACL
MLIDVHSRNMRVLSCFSSETRVNIIELLGKGEWSIGELANELNMSSAIITKHIQTLEEAGIVTTYSVAGTRGRRKLCKLVHNSITLLMHQETAQEEKNTYCVSIPVGQYNSHAVKPTCGLASEQGIIGMVDDPRYFTSPDHVQASHVWLSSGYLEYAIPNYLVGKQRVRRLTISLEIGSEAPGYNDNWPSDLSFHLNGKPIGQWTCPGDFGSSRGVLTPSWWSMGSQHGLLKTLSISAEGTYMDGIRISGITPSELAIAAGQPLYLRIACPEDAIHAGGLCLFGRGFGNYEQDIEITVHYE